MIPVEQAIESIKKAGTRAGVIVQLVYDRNDLAQKKAVIVAAAERASIEAAKDAERNLQSKHNAARMHALEAARESKWLNRDPSVFRKEKELELEAERIRLEKVRLWKLSEPERLQRRYEDARRQSVDQEKKNR